MSCSCTGISNSDRSRWQLTKQTMIPVRINLVQHTQCSNLTSMTQRQESLISAKPGHQIHLALEKLKMTFSSKPPYRRTVLKDCEVKWILARKKHRDVQKDTLHQPQNTNSLRDTGDNTTRMLFEVRMLSHFTPRMLRSGLAQMETPGKTKSSWGMVTVLDLLTS